MAIVGIVVGILFGVYGTGFFLVTALLFMGFTSQQAAGSALVTAVLPVTCFAAFIYYKKGHIRVKETMLLSVLIGIGTVIGSWINTSGFKCLNERNLTLSFAALSIITGIVMMVNINGCLTKIISKGSS